MKIQMLILGAALALVSAAAQAEVYRWTDDQGNVHYGDRRPTGQPAETIDIRTSQPASPAPTEAASATTDETAGDAPTVEAGQPPAAPENPLSAEQRQANCRVARTNLTTIRTNSRIQVEVNGERRYLTAEEIARKRAKMEAMADTYCEEPAA